MKLLFVNDQILPSTETDTEQILNTVSALGLAGAEVRLLLPRKRGGPAPTVTDLSQYYEVLPSFELKTWPRLFPAPRFFEKSAHALATVLNPALGWADIVFTRNISTAVALLLLSSKPVIYETYRPWPDQYPILSLVFRRLGRSPRLIGGIFHSGYTARSFAMAGFPEEKILVARNGHDPRQMEPVLSPKEARLALGLNPDGIVAVYAGHLSVRKGSDVLLDLAKNVPEARFFLVGAKKKERIAKRAASLDNVTLVGWRSKRETVLYLYAADVLVIPPTSDPLKKSGTTVLPLKTYAYLAAGRPILAPGTPDLREVLTHYYNAVLVDPDNPSQAAQALRELVADPETMRRLAKQAQDSSKELTYARRADRILRFAEARLAVFNQLP